jgi:hypothetical protein
MTLDLTFREVRHFIEKHQPQPALIDAADKLLGVLLVCSPIFLGPVGTPLLGLLAVKNELTGLGKGLFKALTTEDDNDFLLHQHGLDRLLPEYLRKRLQLYPDEKQIILKGELDEAKSQFCSPEAAAQLPHERQQPFAVSFPHPTQDLQSLKADLNLLYARLSKGFLAFPEKLSVWDTIPAAEKQKLLEQLGKLPEAALGLFEMQYRELAAQFEDFAVWANLHEHKETQGLIRKLSEYVILRADLAEQINSKIDLGFERLQKTIQSMPRILNSTRATEVVDALSKHYEARINDPIIEDKYEADNKAA